MIRYRLNNYNCCLQYQFNQKFVDNSETVIKAVTFIINHVLSNPVLQQTVWKFASSSEHDNRLMWRTFRTSPEAYSSPVLTTPIMIIQEALYRFLKHAFTGWPRTATMPLKDVSLFYLN